MGAHFKLPPTGGHLPAGKLAGRGLLDAPGLLSPIRRARPNPDTTGARTTDTPTFHCPLWPGCGCLCSTMRPECPGLKSRIGVE
jgi:hypothetical protein